MELRNQFHVPDALLPGKNPPVPTKHRGVQTQ